MIANGTDIGAFIPTINFKVGNDRLNRFIKNAQEEVVRKILGSDLEQILEIPLNEGDSDTHAVLREKTKNAIYYTAFLNAIPMLDLQMSEAGFVVASNQAVSPASRERVDKLIYGTALTKSEAFESLHQFLIDNSKTSLSQYASWRGTPQFAHLSGGYVISLREFNSCYIHGDDSIFGNAVTWDYWYDAIPKMTDALLSDIAEYISGEYITELLEKKRDSEPLLAVENGVDYHIGCAVAAAAHDMKGQMVKQAVLARKIMLRNISSFPTFRNSAAYELPRLNIGDKDNAVADFL